MTRLTSFFFMLSMLSFPARADAQAASAVVRGTVVDVSSAPIVGATVAIEGTTFGAITDSEGKFLILGAEPGTAVVTVSFIGYKRFRSEPLELRRDESCELSVTLEPESSQLDGAVVVATRKVDSDAGLIAQMRSARYVASGISAQTIARTQDKDASEVIRRVPGISVIDDKFVIVRGLAQRYNNVWINGAAVPSSEADTRAFSFDVLPSSQIDNLLIVKSPAPELPADFSGGFIRIRTKVVPEENSLTISYGTGFNSVTHSNDFRYAPGSATDWLGFDNGMRSLKNVPHRVDNDDVTTVDRVTRTGFNNDWRVLSRRPTIDQKLNIALNRRFVTARRDAVGLVAALNYSNTNKSLLRMENSQFGIYNYTEDEPLYNFKYTDNQYTNDVKLGAMLNLSYVPAADKRSCVSRYEFRNIFNQLGRNRFTDREGWRNVSGYYEQQQDEYLYVSRSAYTGQFAGSHDWIRSGAKFDWNAAYSYSNRRQPDRRIVEREKNPENGIYEYSIDQGSVSRYFTSLDEHVVSAGANLSLPLFPDGTLRPELRTGLYGEYKTRRYATRNFLYKWNAYQNKLPAGFGSLPAEQIFAPENLGAPDKLHVQDETHNTDDYSAHSDVLAAYAALNMSLGRFNVYAGVRFESYRSSLESYPSETNFRTRTNTYRYNNALPSLNATYNLTPRMLVRLAYGMSVNRQEFRELSPSTYYDFDMFSTITGNPDLRQAVVQNVDLRYELYPAAGETISVAVFYKHFKNPIEWNYVDAGGSYQFSFENARSARNYGVEIDLRKSLAFIGMNNFMLTLNAAWIESKVLFGEQSREHDRPMQGQSPYLVNAGLFYQNGRIGFAAGILYNRIGKRIVGIGRVSTSGGDTFNSNIPDMYEMPRNSLDLTVGQRLCKWLEAKAAARDLLGDAVRFMQFPRFRDSEGVVHERSQTTKRYYPGRSFSLSLTATF